jgi:hypothetical protein
MDKQRILTITFFVLTLLFAFYSSTITYANAIISVFNSNFTASNNQCDYFKGSDLGSHLYGCISSPISNSDSGIFSWVTSNTNPPVVKSLTIFPQIGGCDPINNPCNPDNGSASGNTADKTGQSGKLVGIWCGYTDCYTLWDTANTYPNQLIRINPNANNGNGDVTGYINITSTTELRPLLTGIDVQYIGVGSVNVYYVRCPSVCGTTTIGTLVTVQGIGLMGETQTITTNQFFKGDNTVTNGWGISSLDLCWFCDGDINNLVDNKFLIISSRQGATTNRAITVIDLATHSEQCGATNSGQSITTSQNTAITRFFNGSRWVHASDANIYAIDLDNCVVTKTTSYATLGLQNYVTAFMSNHTMSRTTSDPTTHNFGVSFFVHHGSSGSLSTITRVNATTFNTLVDFDIGIGAHISSYVAGSNPFNSMTSRVLDRTIIRTDSTSKFQIIFLEGFQGGITGGGCVVIDTNPVEDFVSLTQICDLDNDGIPDIEVGGFTKVTGNTTTLVHQITCQVGFVDCNNPDSKTNGVGLLLLLLLLLASVGVVMFVTFRNDHSLSEIHPIVWFLIVTLVTGVAWQLKWTDGIPFFASIIAVCALGAFKAREWFG